MNNIQECCRECFFPSHDVLRGPNYMIADAVPDGCKDEDCKCHSPFLNWRERFDEIFNWELIFGKNSQSKKKMEEFIESLLLSQIETVLSGVESLKRKAPQGANKYPEIDIAYGSYNQAIDLALTLIKKVGGK